MRRTRFVLPVLLALLGVVAAGCGTAAPAGAPAASPSGVARFSAYKNAQYVFGIAYPSGWSKSIAAPVSTSPKTGERLFQGTFLDPHGTVTKGGQALDGVTVEVYQLDKTVKPGVRYTSTAMRIIGGSLLPKLQHIQVAGKAKAVSVHGDPGWSVGYRFRQQGYIVQALSVLVLKHRYAYWVTGKATSDTWSELWPALRISLGTFRVR